MNDEQILKKSELPQVTVHLLAPLVSFHVLPTSNLSSDTGK